MKQLQNFNGLKVLVNHEIHDMFVMNAAAKNFNTNVKPLNVVIDIGAHCGGLSLTAVQSGAKHVLAFEATSLNYYYLVKNIYLNHFEKIILPYHLAVSTNSGTEQAFYMGNSNIWNSNASKYSTKGKKYKAYSIAFTDILKQFKIIDYLKIDVEGMEFEFIKPTEELGKLLQHVRYLDLEVHPSTLKEDVDVTIEKLSNFLNSCGFESITPKSFVGWNECLK